mmetsp:Transcript_18227/g.49250  ORF Transcript_18227/g.49250 Transcript_18227/m.49250 type:complete len:303 (+) Transcript_18227:890-1798(+)
MESRVVQRQGFDPAASPAAPAPAPGSARSAPAQLDPRHRCVRGAHLRLGHQPAAVPDHAPQVVRRAGRVAPPASDAAQAQHRQGRHGDGRQGRAEEWRGRWRGVHGRKRGERAARRRLPGLRPRGQGLHRRGGPRRRHPEARPAAHSRRALSDARGSPWRPLGQDPLPGLPQPRFDGDPGADEALQGGHCHLSRGRPLRLLLSHHLGARAQADAWPAELCSRALARARRGADLRRLFRHLRYPGLRRAHAPLHHGRRDRRAGRRARSRGLRCGLLPRHLPRRPPPLRRTAGGARAVGRPRAT